MAERLAVLGIILAMALLVRPVYAGPVPKWDRMPDTWSAVDALGRALPPGEKVGPPRSDRFVAMFYFLWLGEHGQTGPWDVSRTLAADPDALSKPTSPPWGPFQAYHHWGEPLLGYYLSDDQWVYAKHAQMLADAGVDVVIFDCTNQITYPKSYTALCQAWSEVRAAGNPTPQIAFLCPFGNPVDPVEELYQSFYKPGLYSHLWFQWKGKPLILADPEYFKGEIRDFFTFRKPQPSYFQGPTGPDQWGWLEVFPQHVFKNSRGEAEMMTVGVAQNSQKAERLSAMSEPDVTGRSWHRGKKDTRYGAVNYGFNFQEQWERALEVDPQLVFVTGWNEWVAMWLNDFAGVRLPVMFVDQFDQEYSRDIEPMRGGHTDNYYYQLVQNVRRYKGARPAPAAGPRRKITIDGDFSDWNDVSPDYRDDIGDVAHRNHPGWGSAGPYINDTGRNDIVQAKVTRDDRNVFFYVRTRQPITPHTDPRWMMLFINTLGGHRAGWEGYTHVVNRHVKDGETTYLDRSTGGWNWQPYRELPYRVRGSEMELAVPIELLGLNAAKPLDFTFKWADNTPLNDDITDFIQYGDTAPNGRFAYRFTEKP